MHGNYESVTVEHTDERANERTNGQTKLFRNSVGEGIDYLHESSSTNYHCYYQLVLAR